MPPDRDLPSPAENRLAYGTALLSTFAWVVSVMPGVHVEPGASDDLASTMQRGVVYLVPTLLLLASVPVAVVLARQAVALRGLLAWAAAFVALYAGGALLADRPGGFRLGVVVALGVCALAALVDAVRLARTPSDDPAAPSVRTGDLRLALALLALLAPAGQLALGQGERATWLAPFVFLAVGAAGERFATSLRGLRVAAVLALALLAVHFVVGVRYALDTGLPRATGWTPWGRATFALAVVLLLMVGGWAALLLRRPRGARVPEGAL